MGSVTTLQGLLFVQVVAFCLANSPPTLSGKAMQRVVVKLGKSNHKLSCEAKTDMPELTQWKKDGQSIHPGWERFKVSQEGDLRIKDIEKGDAGLYTCIATNGFGSLSVNYTFIVLDETKGVFYEGDKEYKVTADEDLNKDGSIPYFEDLEQMKKSMTLEKPVRSRIRLSCKADGNPKPEISWLKNAQPFPQKHYHPVLKISDVTIAESGAYTCVAKNRLGQVNFTYNVQVIDEISEKPRLIAPHPLNQTVEPGATVSFQCFIESGVLPEVKWLKRIDRPDEAHSNSGLIEYGNEKFMVLKNAGDLMQKSDGSYLNKLVITKVQPKDAGIFVCFATNRKGFNTRKAHLTIRTGSGDHSPDGAWDPNDPSVSQHTTNNSSNDTSDDSDTNLPLLIGLPSCAVLVLILLAVFLMQRNNRCRRSENNAKAARPPVPHHERDAFYYSNCQQQPQTVNPLLTSREKLPPKTPTPSVDMTGSEFSSVSRTHPNPHYYHPNHMNYGY
ncbi:unnamed protein product [Lymnaea stagnalis]|uniref:receptor protein-tyrosine kinase n=1 Tax=Lymnaea stagnalis TaxID=6523 RepID=A0AAV2IH82_LYMST